MKRIPSIILTIIFFVATFCTIFSGCSKTDDSSVITLKVMSWEDYIDNEKYEDEETGITEGSVIDEFEKYCKNELKKNVKVEYSTVGTNEEMYTKINLNKESYDLVCPSEYMIQKMIDEDMLVPLDRNDGKLSVYDDNVSAYISDLFKRILIDKNDSATSLYNYAACYMWGTMGFVYNPIHVDENDICHWSAVWNEKYKNKCTIKDSVRDSYVLALGYAYENELNEYARLFKNETAENRLSAAEYNLKITDVFNNVSDEAIERTGKLLSELAPTLYGYEVDSGKKDMAAGKIWINFAWSGDAVYAMDFAEDPEEVGENLAELNYVVPEEGSNIFFDGWVMPKGSNVELAQEYINFISQPKIAQRNMDFIGYTTSIATEEIFENVIDNYGYASEDVVCENGKYYVADNNEKIIGDDGNVIEVFPVDLTYLFKKEDDEKDYIVYTEVLGRQFSAQYPDYDTVVRCTVMRHFPDDKLVKLNKMWEDSKPTAWQGVFIASLIVLIIIITIFAFIKIANTGIVRKRVKKGYKEISREQIK